MSEQPERRVLSGDPNLDEALTSADQLNNLGPDAYTQGGSALISEVAARAALAEAVTNRARLLTDLLRENVLGDKPLFLSDELDSRYHVELIRLITSITGGRP